MKHTKRTSLLAGVLICAAMLLVGCSEQAIPLAQGWSPPITVTASKSGLVGGVELYKWNGTTLVLQGLDDRRSRCFLMDRNSNSWDEGSLTGVPLGYLWAYPTIDQASDEVFFEQGYIENEQLIMKVLIGRMSGNVVVRDAMEKKWLLDKKKLFGETGSNVQLGLLPGARDWPSLGTGVINGSDTYIPYCLRGHTRHGKIIYEGEGPFNNGSFHSDDSGLNWRVEQLSDFEAWLPSLCRTKGYYYYIAVKNYQGDLWFARKPAESSSWDTPKVLTTTFCNSALYWKYVATADEDTIHLCWLDRRHEKRRFSLEDPSRDNYEVVYCHRNDSDSDWNKGIILSKGLFYSYSPSMSVEGEKIVIAWAGIQTAEDWHNEDNSNDIYYVTSKDGGKTWTKPLMLTDKAKDGVTSGKPQVMLLKGVIHLFYIQGKRESQQFSPGLTKLNQGPWPIYYTQRPFPD